MCVFLCVFRCNAQIARYCGKLQQGTYICVHKVPFLLFLLNFMYMDMQSIQVQLKEVKQSPIASTSAVEPSVPGSPSGFGYVLVRNADCALRLRIYEYKTSEEDRKGCIARAFKRMLIGHRLVRG